MRFQIDYGSRIPMGFVAEAAPLGSPTVQVLLTGFYSSEDGDYLIKCLDGYSQCILDMLPPEQRPRESQIDQLIAIIHRNGKASVYVNELPMTARLKVKRDVTAGEPIGRDDVVDLYEVELGDLEIPADTGLVAILSAGWRKAVFFDYTPIAPQPMKRTVDPRTIFAEILTYLHFQHRFKITDDQWAELTRQGWFPFIGLPTQHLESILTHASLKVPIDPLLPGMLNEAQSLSSRLRKLVAARADLQPHRGTLTKALEHFEAGDYLSSTQMIFPRIEGVMRSWHSAVTPGDISQRSLAASSVADPQHQRHRFSLLLPHRFESFLTDVYFANFDPSNVTCVSRNTVSHGVAPEEQLTLKAAILGVLILDQLLRLMAPPELPTRATRTP